MLKEERCIDCLALVWDLLKETLFLQTEVNTTGRSV